MSLGILLGVQAGILAIVIIAFLLVYVARLKKNLAGLQALFVKLKDDLGGASLLSHLQEAQKQTLAACQKDTAAYNPEHDAQDQAIALRSAALAAEIAFIEARQAGKTSFDAVMAPYRLLGDQIALYLTGMRENLKGQAAADYQHKITELQRQLEALHRKHKTLEDTQRRMKNLVDLLEAGNQTERSKDQIEQSLHMALASMCESFSDAVSVREIVYLYHEAYFDRRNGGGHAPAHNTSFDDVGGNASPVNMAPFDASPHIDMLNNIIDEQNQLVAELQARILQLETSNERAEIEEKADAIAQQVQEAKTAIEMLEIELSKMKDGTGAAYNNEEVMDIIEQFTEESAALVERLHMLTNQNKLLSTENEQMRLQIDQSVETDEPLVAGLKTRLQQQTDEILDLQASYKKLEEQYLTLYSTTQTLPGEAI